MVWGMPAAVGSEAPFGVHVDGNCDGAGERRHVAGQLLKTHVLIVDAE